MARTLHEKADVIPLLAEVFREFGYEGASLSSITEMTGLAKGSLYHFFPGGKEEMAAEILKHVDAWFVANVFVPLEREEPRAAVAMMWKSIDEYFHSGRRICLVGAFAIDDTRDRFAALIRSYFQRWVDALAGALSRAGVDRTTARSRAEESVIGIQGALTVARALNEDTIFARTIRRLSARVEEDLKHSVRPHP